MPKPMSYLEPHIAWRYLWSKKSHNAINIVSGVSAVAVCVVTAALICVLSIMNGLGNEVEKMFSRFDPDLRITACEGKFFSLSSEGFAAIRALDAVDIAAPTIEETALIEFEDHQLPALVKGVDTCYQALTDIDSILVDGHYSVFDGAFERAVIGQGLAWQLGIGARFLSAIHLYAPRRTGRVNLMRPDQAFLKKSCYIAGIFAVNQVEYDDHMMLVSLPLARELFGYAPDEVTALELRLTPGADIRRTKKQIHRLLGSGYEVRDRYEQQEDFYRILRIEKWLTALLLLFILLIAAFNLVGSLTMLMLDKKEDIRTLRNLGADNQMIRRIFTLEGWLIAASGALIGVVIGLVLCLVQQHFGLIKLGSGTEYVLSAYPVAVQAGDILVVLLSVLLIGFVAAFIPTRRLPVLCLAALLLTACGDKSRPDAPEQQPVADSLLTLAKVKNNGQWYPGVDCNVISLDLYSEGLRFNERGYIEGTGTNLYFSDIFLPLTDTVLTAGTYSLDTTATVYTALPGVTYDNTVGGSYLLLIEQNKLKSIILLKSGSFVVAEEDSILHLTFDLTTTDDKPYRASYVGTLK